MNFRLISPWSGILAALLTLSVLEGCGPPPQPIPPAFSLYGYKGLAVAPFDNNTQDKALSSAFSDEMTIEVSALNAVPIIEAGRVQVFLDQNNATSSDLLVNDPLRQRLKARFHCDLILMGTATAYVEVLKDDAPCRQGDNSQWGFTTHRKVTASGTYKILDSDTANLVWSDKNDGYSWKNTWNPLPVPQNVTVLDQLGQFINLADIFHHRVIQEGDLEPASMERNDPSVLIYPKSHTFAELRQNAIYQNIHGMVEDFRGHQGWVPNGVATP